MKSKMSLSDLEQEVDSKMNVTKGSYIVRYIDLRSSPWSSLEPKQASRSLVSPDLGDEHWRRLKVFGGQVSY